MSITELAVHNVLRTYSRQDRIGRIQSQRKASAEGASDKVDLSPAAQKISVLGKVASDIVTAKFPEASEKQRAALVRPQSDLLLRSHAGEVEDPKVSSEKLEQRLRATYLPEG